MFLKSMIPVLGWMIAAHGQLLVNNKNFANRMLEAVNELRKVYEVSQLNLADDELTEKAKELAAKSDLTSINSHLRDNPKDFADFSVNVALIDPPCAERITPKKLVTTFAILAGTSDWPCPSPFEKFGGEEVFWTPSVGKIKRLESNDMTIRGEGFWPFIMEKQGQSVAVGFRKTLEKTVVVLLFNSWKTVKLPISLGARLTSPFKFDVVVQKATAGCVNVAPKEALSRLCTEPGEPRGHETYGQLACQPPKEHLQRDGLFRMQCKAFKIANQNFAKCVGNGLRHGYGTLDGSLTRIILDNACKGRLNAQTDDFFHYAARSWALYAEEE